MNATKQAQERKALLTSMLDRMECNSAFQMMLEQPTAFLIREEIRKEIHVMIHAKHTAKLYITPRLLRVFEIQSMMDFACGITCVVSGGLPNDWLVTE